MQTQGETQSEAVKATSGVMYMSLASVASLVVESVLALAVPAVLGRTDYGNWVVFRSIIGMMFTSSLLGIGRVVGVYYVSKVANQQHLEAARLYKAIMSIRVVVGLLVASIGFALVLASGNPSLTSTAGGLLACCILFKVVSNTLILLMYGHREFGKLAVASFLQQCTVPLVIMLGYMAGGFSLVPWACALADGAIMLACVVMAGRHVSWPKGWPAREEMRTVLHFAGLVTVSTLSMNMLMNGIPYLMGLVGVSVVQIGYFGLAVRIANLGHHTLQQLANSIFPSFRVVLETHGTGKVMQWRSFICRLGTLIILAVLGSFLLVGHRLVPVLWGKDFAQATPLIALLLVALVPQWIGTEYIAVLTLVEKPSETAKSVLWLTAVFLPVFFWLTPSLAATGAALALLAGMLVRMLSTMFYTWRQVHDHLGLTRLWVPGLVAAAAFGIEKLADSAALELLALAGWVLVFAASAVLSRSITREEVLRLIGNMTSALRSSRFARRRNATANG
ncbi:MAG: polysaccharide biosynthesis C-terminal domain-containing protein [Kiritimatiellae bacterium]|nr:polysaccharide biosynthesis C-terminal domain-containing protein [Kiritimatiellia bacterium]